MVKELQGLSLKIDLVSPDNQLVNTEEVLQASHRTSGQRPPAAPLEEEKAEVLHENEVVIAAGAAKAESTSKGNDSLTAIIEADLDFEKEFKAGQAKVPEEATQDVTSEEVDKGKST